MSEIVQNRDIVTVQIRNVLSNGTNISHLEWPWNSLYLFETFRTPTHQWIWHVLTTLCIYMNEKVSVVFNHNCFRKMKDFSTLGHHCQEAIKLVLSYWWFSDNYTQRNNWSSTRRGYDAVTYLVDASSCDTTRMISSSFSISRKISRLLPSDTPHTVQ